jgi:hypothetical protein
MPYLCYFNTAFQFLWIERPMPYVVYKNGSCTSRHRTTLPQQSESNVHSVPAGHHAALSLPRPMSSSTPSNIGNSIWHEVLLSILWKIEHSRNVAIFQNFDHPSSFTIRMSVQPLIYGCIGLKKWTIMLPPPHGETISLHTLVKLQENVKDVDFISNRVQIAYGGKWFRILVNWTPHALFMLYHYYFPVLVNWTPNVICGFQKWFMHLRTPIHSFSTVRKQCGFGSRWTSQRPPASKTHE